MNSSGSTETASETSAGYREPKKYAVLGGTFNPPHNGHLAVIRHVLEHTQFERIIVVPTHTPAHKTAADVPAEQRLEMTRLAVEQIPECIVDDCEVHRKGTSYTIETVREIRRRYAVDGELGFIIGFDLIDGLTSWKEWRLLRREVFFIIAKRNQESRNLNIPLEEDRYIILENSLIPISSESIRELIRNGKSEEAEDDLPPQVSAYIRNHGLYRS
jgi:nicotinate-nucleotide adenylyltransferase